MHRAAFQQPASCSSWLNQVELWFAKIQRDVIDRGAFTSVSDLARKLRKYPRDTVHWFSIPRSLQQLNPHSIRIFRERVPKIPKLARLDRELDSFAMERRRRFVYLRDL